MRERLIKAAIQWALALIFIVIAWPFLFIFANDGVRP